MKLTSLFVLIGCLHLSAASYSQAVTLGVKDQSLIEVFKSIQKQTGYRFVYNVRFLKSAKPVSISAKQMPLGHFLDEVLKEQELTYEIREKTILIGRAKQRPVANPKQAEEEPLQEREITGTVTDEQRNPLEGVTVSVKGTNQATVTNESGGYRIQLPPNANVLVFTMLGYETAEHTIIDGQTTGDVSLRASYSDLDEVVVVGYGTQRKVNLTGAVSHVKGDEISERTFANSTSALQGVASGLMIVDKGGEPGSENTSINIRGIGTLGNANPLILVDNVPVNSLNDVFPQDIESISVLKDAASAAIYGARAANGVILITTKRGSEQRLTVNYNTNYSLQNPTRIPKSVDAAMYMEILNEARTNIGNPPRYSEEYINNTLSGTDPHRYPWTDWSDFMFRDALFGQHMLSISGGGEINQVRLSLNYQDQDGVVDMVNSKRFSVRLNNDYKLHDKLSISTDLSYITRDNTKPYRIDNVYWMFYSDLPWTSAPYYPDGSYTYPSNRGNPAANIYDSGYRDAKENNFMASGTADWEIVENLHLKGRYSTLINNMSMKNYAYAQEFTDYYTGARIGRWDSSLQEGRNNQLDTDMSLTLDYSRAIGNHQIAGLVGYQEFVTNRNNLDASRMYFAYNELQELGLGDLTTRTNNGGSSKSVLKSLFGRLNYNYKEKYLLEANFRYDGSSRFADGRRWGFFPSFSGGWRISQEPFMQNVGFLDELKLRGSWGQLGNQDINLFQFFQTINVSLPYPFGGRLENGAAMTSLANQYITWETSVASNIGLDADILKGLFSISGEYFYRRTNDILLNVEIPFTIGLGAPTQNVGVVENKGWEVTLSHRNNVGALNYSVGANLSDVRNKVLSLGGIGPQVGRDDGGGTDYLLGEGYAMRTIWGFEYLGLMTQEDFDNGYPVVNTAAAVGSPKFRDRNNDGILNDLDKTAIGETIPRYLYGLNLKADLKGFYVDVFLQGALKNSTHVGGGVRDGVFWDGFVWEKWADRYHPEKNPNGSFPIVMLQRSGPSNVTSDFWLQSSAYLRLKSLQFGYHLPTNLMQTIGVQRCRVFVAGTNLFTSTETVYDPEIGSFDPGTNISRGNYYPQIRTFSAGIDVTF